MSFIEQINGRRIKTLGQDIAEDVGSIGQWWDTLGESEAAIFADDYWDCTVRPIRTNDVIRVRYHDPVTDGISGNWDVLVGYAKGADKRAPDFTYRSKLLKVMSGYSTLDVKDVKGLVGTTSFQMTASPGAALVGLYAFVDGRAVSSGANVSLRSGADDGDVVVLSIPAGASWGSYASAVTGFEGDAATSYKINVSAGAGETGNFNLHIVGIWG